MKALVGVLALCASVAQAADMTVLRYVEQDPGDPPYATRILVTPAFLRMDGGEDGGDFVLLDRGRRQVINVMRDSRTALVFSPGSVPAPPANWRAKLDARPVAGGRQRYRLVVNGSVCSEGLLAPRLSPDAARALDELKTVLAATQYRVWKDSPRALQHDCDLANQVWSFGLLLKRGLPLSEREFSGRTREFESVRRVPLQTDLFRVPEGLPRIDAPS
ncbi:MAG: hypothetical protein LDL19_11120 [Thiobacillus sp.]|nr:hypothetical protein [Thiobacillus sp.]